MELEQIANVTWGEILFGGGIIALLSFILNWLGYKYNIKRDQKKDIEKYVDLKSESLKEDIIELKESKADNALFKSEINRLDTTYEMIIENNKESKEEMLCQFEMVIDGIKDFKSDLKTSVNEGFKQMHEELREHRCLIAEHNEKLNKHIAEDHK